MKIAIFFEASGIVREAFRARGFDATSIDLRPTQRPGPHIQGDVFDHLADGWDMAVMHPDCTYMARSGLHWNARVQGRVLMTDRSIHYVRILMDAPIERWALENPIGCIGTRIRPADQIIQPNWFGDDASKATCLWLKGLPRLKQTGPRQGPDGRAGRRATPRHDRHV